MCFGGCALHDARCDRVSARGVGGRGAHAVGVGTLARRALAAYAPVCACAVEQLEGAVRRLGGPADGQQAEPTVERDLWRRRRHRAGAKVTALALAWAWAWA